MTYLAILSLNILLGVFVPLVLILSTIVKPFVEWRLYGEMRKKAREQALKQQAREQAQKQQAREQAQKQEKKKISVTKIIYNTLVGILILGTLFGSIVLSWVMALPNWKDIPALIKQDYEEVTGVMTSIKYGDEGSSWRSWGFDVVKLNGENYKYDSLDLEPYIQREEVTLHYLKHTNYIMKVSDRHGHVVAHEFSQETFIMLLLIHLLITFFYFLRRGISYNVDRRRRIVTLSFHIFTVLILFIFSFTPDRITSLVVVLLVHGLLHFIQVFGGLWRNLA